MRVSGDAFSIPAAHRAYDRTLCAGGAQRQMSRIDSFFVQHPGMLIVTSLHAPSQQTTRTDQKRRDNVTEDRCAKQTHESEFEWPVVVHGANQNYFLDAIRIIERARRGYSAAV